MKLLFCPHCHDVRKLGSEPNPDQHNTLLTRCKCGRSWGRYTDDINAVYGGDAVMLGFNNHSLHTAIELQRGFGDLRPDKGRGFTAFVIPESAPTVKRERALASPSAPGAGG